MARHTPFCLYLLLAVSEVSGKDTSFVLVYIMPKHICHPVQIKVKVAFKPLEQGINLADQFSRFF